MPLTIGCGPLPITPLCGGYDAGCTSSDSCCNGFCWAGTGTCATLSCDDPQVLSTCAERGLPSVTCAIDGGLLLLGCGG